jgi:hypothetical protein
MIPVIPQISHAAGMRRDDICLYVCRTSRTKLNDIVKDRNSTAKAVWRAEIVLATAEGHGTNEIMRCTAKCKRCTEATCSLASSA